MDYRCSSGSLGNSSQALGPIDPGGDGRLKLWFRPSGLPFFFGARFSFHTHSSLLTFFCYFVLFDSCCSYARVFGKTLTQELIIFYCLTEWYLVYFPSVQLQVHNVYSERKGRNTCALVYLYL